MACRLMVVTSDFGSDNLGSSPSKPAMLYNVFMVNHPRVKLPSTFITAERDFNSKFVDVMATVLGSVGFIWFCLLLDVAGFAGLIYQTTQAINTHTNLLITIELWVTFIAQAVIQLVALPVLQNYANRQSAMTDAKAAADHMALTHIANMTDAIAQKLEINNKVL